MQTDEIVDQINQRFEVEATLFLDDERIATTIMQDGKRAVGTKLNLVIAEKYYGKGKKYVGRADILGKQYITAYMPLLGPDNKPLGIVFAGQDNSDS